MCDLFQLHSYARNRGSFFVGCNPFLKENRGRRKINVTGENEMPGLPRLGQTQQGVKKMVIIKTGEYKEERFQKKIKNC